MKQSLQLKISQSLTMTPQLQQAIKLLQLSSLDLESEIQEALESNPLLEIESPNEQSIDSSNKEPASNLSGTEPTSSEERDSSEAIKSDKIESEMVSDSQWEDWGYVSQSSGPKPDDASSFDPTHAAPQGECRCGP